MREDFKASGGARRSRAGVGGTFRVFGVRTRERRKFVLRAVFELFTRSDGVRVAAILVDGGRERNRRVATPRRRGWVRFVRSRHVRVVEFKQRRCTGGYVLVGVWNFTVSSATTHARRVGSYLSSRVGHVKPQGEIFGERFWGWREEEKARLASLRGRYGRRRDGFTHGGDYKLIRRWWEEGGRQGEQR